MILVIAIVYVAIVVGYCCRERHDQMSRLSHNGSPERSTS